MASRKPVIHGRDHVPGGADPIPGSSGTSLIVTDFITTVDPTTQIDIGDGLALLDGGGGEAFISVVQPATIYAVGEASQSGTWPGAYTPITFTTTESNGVTAASDSWTIVTTGLYFVQAEAILFLNGPTTADVTVEPELQLFIVGTGTTAFDWAASARLPVAYSADVDWFPGLSVSKLITLGAGTVLTFRVDATATGTPGMTLGKWGMWKVGP